MLFFEWTTIRQYLMVFLVRLSVWNVFTLLESKMKKLLIMILILGVSLPAFGTEIKLACTTSAPGSGKITHSEFVFDEEKGTVGIYESSAKVACDSRIAATTDGDYSCDYAEISGTEASYISKYTSNLKGSRVVAITKTAVDRIDGKYEASLTRKGYPSDFPKVLIFDSGACVPFKQSF